jgi:hypothetical protein
MHSQSQLPFVIASESSSRFFSLLLVFVVGLAALPFAAAESGNQDTPEPGSIEAISASTTDTDRGEKVKHGWS